MSELWETFCEKLTTAGYTLKDLEYCNDDLFLTIAEEIGLFSPLQISGLLSQWHRRRRGTTAGASHTPATAAAGAGAVVSVGASFTDVKPGAAYPVASIRQSAQRLLERGVARAAGSGVSVSTNTRDVIGVEAPLSSWHAFRRCQEQQSSNAASGANEGRQRARGAVTLLWKLCSSATLTKIERACATSSMLTLSGLDDMDGLCESGIVLYRESAVTLGSNALTVAALRLRAEEGWALVGFDAAVGTPRSVTADEVGNLRHFSMAQCLEMLQEAGFDSLSVESHGAVVLCDATQLIPRNVVYFRVDGDADPPAQREQRVQPSVLASRLAQNGMNTSNAHEQRSDSRRLEYSAVDDDYERARGPAPASRHVVKARSDSAATNGMPDEPPMPRAAAREVDDSHAIPASAAPGVAAPLNSPPGQGSPKCDLHPRKDVEFWSPTEKRLLCSHCLYYDGYSRETCLPIEAAARQEVPRLQRWMSNAATFTKEVQTVTQLFADAKEDVERQEEKVAKDIEQQFSLVRGKLNTLETDMLNAVHSQSRTRRQEVEAASRDVADSVAQVAKLLKDMEAPVKLYVDGGSGGVAVTTCVQLLRGVQRAFGDWPTVDIAPYGVIQPLGNFLAEADTALNGLPQVVVAPGRVELPEAIDVNFLHADCE